jgi:hypothetical protein
MTVGAHRGATCDSDRSEVLIGISIAFGEKVGSSLVLMFGTIDCINDNLACFEDGFNDCGPSSMLAVTASTSSSPSHS